MRSPPSQRGARPALSLLALLQAWWWCKLARAQIQDFKPGAHQFAAITPGRPVAGWHNLHGDLARTGAVLLDQLGLNTYLIAQNFTFRGNDPRPSLVEFDFMVLPWLHHRLKDIEATGRPVMLVPYNKLEGKKMSLVPSRFLGYLCVSALCQHMAYAQGLPFLRVSQRYALDTIRVNASSPPTQITTLISFYEEYSARHPVHGVMPLERWREVTAGLPPESVTLCARGHGHVPPLCNDVTELKRSKALLHIKYWGHVCNAVGKALAMGVPVLMDRPTYEMGGYEGYLVPGVNGWVADSVPALAAALRDEALLAQLRAGAQALARQYQLPYPKAEVARVASELLARLDAVMPSAAKEGVGVSRQRAQKLFHALSTAATTAHSRKRERRRSCR